MPPWRNLSYRLLLMNNHEEEMNGLSTCIRFLLLLPGSRKFRRLCFSLVVVLLVLTAAAIYYYNRRFNYIINHYVAREDDAIILSTTFYNTSRSFDDNTIVVLINAHQVFHLKHPTLRAIVLNATNKEIVHLKVSQVVGQLPFYCRWVPFIAVGKTLKNLETIELATNDETRLRLSYRSPQRASRPVVACFSPLFLNEKWQLLILTLEVYSFYGAYSHFYIRSMMADLFRILRTYSKVTVQPWPRLQLGDTRAHTSGFDPNLEVEFRNQAAAMTDCLLYYKESTRFIIFPDTDDVIIPRLGRNYEDEFALIFDDFPKAASVAYNMSQAQITAANLPSMYSVANILKSVKYTNETRWGKLVVKPEHVDSAWIHESYSIRDGFEKVALDVELNSATHMRFWNMTSAKFAPKDVEPRYNPLYKNDSKQVLISRKDLKAIEEAFHKHLAEYKDLFHNLPRFALYYPLIEQCYNKIFYNGEIHLQCTGPEMCDLPPFPGIDCTNVRAEYGTFYGYRSVYFHYLKSVDFEIGHDGCTM